MKAFAQFLAIVALLFALPLLGWGALVVLTLAAGDGSHGAMHELEAVAALGLGAVALAASGAALAAAECIGRRAKVASQPARPAPAPKSAAPKSAALRDHTPQSPF